MRFDTAVDIILDLEGGYVNNPADPGGETKYGISKRSFPHLDIAALTREDAKKIYYTHYWKASGADKMPDPLALMHFDTAVNMGISRAALFLARSKGDVLEYAALRLKHYAELKHWQDFGRGWVRRVAHVLEAGQGKPVALQSNLVRLVGFTEQQRVILLGGTTLAVGEGVNATLETTMSGLKVVTLRPNNPH